MKRALALLVLAALAAGCSGRDAQEAQLLLAQSEAAFASVRSATFTLRLSTSGAPEDYAMTMAGGGYLKGKRAGDVYVRITAEEDEFHEVVFVQRGGRISGNIDGHRFPTMAAPKANGSPIGALDIGRYVKDVRVEKGKLIEGEPMTKLTGVIDTAGLLQDSLSAIGEVTQLGGSDFDLSDALGDSRVVLYVSDVTHLPMLGLVDMPIKAPGEKFELHMDFAYTSINEPVRFP